MLRKLFVILLLTALAIPSFGQATPWEKKLPFAEATISYKITGTERGTQTLYIKDGGKTMAKHRQTEMKIFGMKQKTNTFELTTTDWVYAANLSKKTGTKVANPKKFMLEEFNKLSAADKAKATANAEKLGVTLVAGMQGEIIRNAAKIQGYDCDKVTIMGVTSFVMSGTNIEMKSNSNVMGIKMNSEVSSIKTGTSFPANAFTLPSNINFTHNTQAEQMHRAAAKNMIASLVSGSAQMNSSMGQGMPSMEEIQAQMNAANESDNDDEEEEEAAPAPTQKKNNKIKMPNLKKLFKF